MGQADHAPCVVCSHHKASIPCLTCSTVNYCSTTFQVKDSNNEHHECLPYTILHENRCGRLLMASRDISAGEVLFNDIPGAVGPDNNPRPVCLTCYKRLPGLVYRCRHCSWPLCSPFCQRDDSPHVRECQLFQKYSPRFNIEDFSKPCPWYNAIMVLRILWLKENKPDTWKLLDMLMDHLEEEKVESKRKNGVIDFIHNHCKLTHFKEKEIRHVIGIIDTNAYIIGENPNKDVDLQGLFPITSILNHNCTSNTICYAKDNFTFACRAVMPIKKGEEITTNYLHYHYHYFGLSYRYPELSQHWHFKCGCYRCRDFTELGTMSDALVCTDCEEGRLSPLNLNENAEWVCGTCYASLPAEIVNKALNDSWDLIEETPKFDVKALLAVLHNLLKTFDENHYYPLEVKRRIIENIGETKGYEYDGLAEAWLEKKVNFCRDHLKVQRKLAPGLSEYRAYISNHIAEPLYWLAKKRYLEKKSSSQDLTNTMEEVANQLLLVIQIWGPYRRRSQERIAAEKAKEFLEMVDEKYLHRHLGDTADEVLVENKLKIYRSIDF